MSTQNKQIKRITGEINRTLIRIEMNIAKLTQLQNLLAKHHVNRVAAFKAHLTMARKRTGARVQGPGSRRRSDAKVSVVR